MEKQTIEMVDVRGHEPLPKDDSSIIWSDHSNEYILKSEALEHVADGEIVHQDYEDEYCSVEHRDGLLYPQEDVVWSGLVEEWIHNEDAIQDYHNEYWATREHFSDHGDYRYITEGRAEEYYLHYDSTTYCHDIEDYVHEDDAHWHEGTEESYYHESNIPRDDDRSLIHAYHNGPASEDISEGAQFRIGFEVEKNSLNGYDEEGDEVGEYDFFARFETDSSCGVEAITHILPLSGVRSKRRKKLFRMMDCASDIINEDCETNCGGHVTISVAQTPTLAKLNKFMSPLNLLEKMRGNLGIVYALYRYRLTNSYCNGCKDLKDPQHHSGHLVVEIKDFNALEIRLFNRVRNVKQLKLRYDLMYILVRRSLDGTDFEGILEELTPILKQMYGGRTTKVAEIKSLARDFRHYLISDQVSDSIEQFINPNNEEE